MEKSKELFKKYRWVLLIIVFLILSYIGLNKLSEYRGINIPIITKYNKIKECKTRILGIIKSPTTAKFSDIEYNVNKAIISTGIYSYQESGLKIEVKLLSGILFWKYIQGSGQVSTGQVEILSGGYIKTQIQNNEFIAENETKSQEISDNLYSLNTSYELQQAKISFTDLSNKWLYLFKSNMAISVVIKGMYDIIIAGNIDSQNSYGAMVRSKFHCEKVNNEEMFGEVLE